MIENTMKKLTVADPETKSPDLEVENVAALRALFPELVTEGTDGVAVNLDVLKQLVGDQTVTDAEEKYGLNWHGKRRARQLALTPSTGTLRPFPEESVDWITTQNVMIEGDNLEVLKLLQKSYAGKVKLIYIDPPYNTGKDFVYPDNFQDNIRNYLELTGQIADGKKLSSNTEASGRFHTDWLNMMYPRLKLSRNLLRADGVVFISIDDSEANTLRTICDEMFGEENFVAQLVWTQGRKSMAAQVAINHEYCLVYCKDRAEALSASASDDRSDWMEKKAGLDEIYAAFADSKARNGDNHTAIEADMKRFFAELPENHPSTAHAHYHNVDANGLYFAGDISQGTGSGGRFDVLHPATGLPCKVPTGGWRFGTDKLPGLLSQARIHFGPDHTTVPCLKRYLRETEFEVASSVFYRDGRGAGKRLAKLLAPGVFAYPKDEEVLARFVRYVTSELDSAPIILDFFAGSGTLGHAVMAQNAADGGNRRFVLVQLPEPLDPAKKDQSVAAGFCDRLGKPRNIAELTKERLRRAGRKIREENPVAGDLGFRVFKLDSSNIRAWEPDRDKFTETLEHSVEHLKIDRTEQDILFELLLKLGLDLCVPIETKKVKGAAKQAHAIHSIGAGSLLVCLSHDIPTADVEPLALAIVAWHEALKPAGETSVVFRDSAFADDVAKTNLSAILQQHGLETVRSL
jgi:adenine-specific DNA-methyltransferase